MLDLHHVTHDLNTDLSIVYCLRVGSGGIYGTGCNFEGGGVQVSLGKITKIRAFPHLVPYMPPDPAPLQVCIGLTKPKKKKWF